MQNVNLKSLLLKTVINLIGILVIAILFEAVFQLVKTGSREIFIEKTKEVFKLRRIVLWTLISFIVTIIQINRSNQKKKRFSDHPRSPLSKS